MTSETAYEEAYVWIWLPDATEPVVAGLLTQEGGELHFNYGKSYLERENAIAIYDRELPLRAGDIPPQTGLSMPNCIRDASPDAWGRRVLINRKLGLRGKDAALTDLSELTYLLDSGSDRIGALDFQVSATVYEARVTDQASLADMMEAAARVEKGVALGPDLQKALQHGSSLGGARPKTILTADHKKYIAKFSKETDLFSFVKAEFVAMRLASMAGLSVAPVSLAQTMGKDVLLVERFDRVRTGERWHRKAILSALTLLGLDEMMAAYASYQDLAEIVRHRFTDATVALKELYGRIVFNVLCGNTDDHARNHAAFWDGAKLTLTPAYDICPQSRTGNEASQAMLISGSDRMSRLSVCLAAANSFLLSEQEAQELIVGQIETIKRNWKNVCDKAELTETDRALLWRRQILNPYAFYGAPQRIAQAEPKTSST